MPGTFVLFLLIGIGLLFLTISLCLIYSIPILFIQRFRHRTNILTLNICLTIMCFSAIHIGCSIVSIYYRKVLLNNFVCNLTVYIRIMISFQTAFTFVIVSIHRLGCVVYYSNIFFKTKKWVILCIASQWIIGLIAPLIFLSTNSEDCAYPQWVTIYILIVGIVMSSLICFIVNMRIFIYVYSSSRRMRMHVKIERLQSVSIMISNNAKQRISRRDLRLLLYMIYMFLTFLIGWAPFYILMIMSHYMEISGILAGFFSLWAEISLICVVISLFVYNEELRRYLQNLISKYFCCMPYCQ